jgi:hypothetical protein
MRLRCLLVGHRYMDAYWLERVPRYTDVSIDAYWFWMHGEECERCGARGFGHPEKVGVGR